MAEWTLMNAPASRSRYNTRPGVPGAAPTVEPIPTLSPEEIAKKNLQQPPLFLLLKRTSPASLELTNAVTDQVIYKIRETGRGSFSSKPDYEFFRPSAGDLFIGSIRVGKRGTELKLPVTGKTFEDPEKYISDGKAQMKWVETHVGRQKAPDGANVVPTAGAPASWVVELDCFKDSVDEDSMCAVKLFDTMPNGRFEIWDKDACVDVGGDWNLLDEYVTIAYANMEKARRKLMMARDPNGPGLAGLGMAGGAIVG